MTICKTVIHSTCIQSVSEDFDDLVIRTPRTPGLPDVAHLGETPGVARGEGGVSAPKLCRPGMLVP